MTLHIPTLFLAVALNSAVCLIVLFVVWHINRSVEGVLQWWLALLLNAVGFLLVSLAAPGAAQAGPAMVWLSNLMTMLASALILEGSLRFRGVGSRYRLPVLLGVCTLAAVPLWWVRGTEQRFLVIDVVGVAFFAAAAVVMVWRPASREEGRVNGLSALFLLLLALVLLVRWISVALPGWQPFGRPLVSLPLVFSAIFLFVMGWTYSVILACYYRVNQKALALARLDSLTGLPNRRSIDETLEASLRRARRGEQPFAVVILDLNRFKEVNDRLGHAVGDALLVAVSERLRGFLRGGDFAGRLGGDEFLVVLHGVDSDEAGRAALRRLRDGVAGPVQLDGHVLEISVGAGLSRWPVDGDSLDALLSRADANMYRDKHPSPGGGSPPAQGPAGRQRA